MRTLPQRIINRVNKLVAVKNVGGAPVAVIANAGCISFSAPYFPLQSMFGSRNEYAGKVPAWASARKRSNGEKFSGA
jgi:hypothetical protein